MGVCQTNDHKIRQRRLTKTTIYKINDNKVILNNSTREKKPKKFEKLKINEINCDNFYSINNNFNYSIVDSNSNNKDDNKNNESIDDLNLMNHPIENLTKTKESQPLNNDIINNEKYQKLLVYFNMAIQQFPYNRLSPYQIISYETEYTSSKLIPPYKFIETKKYSLIFNKIYELCFLKCEPLLNNIYDEKKITNLLFLRSVIVLLTENYLDKTVQDISNTIIEFAYENNNNKILNINNLYMLINNYCEICYQILFYFIIAYSQYTEEQYYEYLNNQNILIEDMYSNSDIDIFCLNTLFNNNKGNYKLEEITTQWSDFICNKKNSIEEYNIEKDEKNITNIKKKIITMINPYHLFQILAGIKIEKI